MYGNYSVLLKSNRNKNFGTISSKSTESGVDTLVISGNLSQDITNGTILVVSELVTRNTLTNTSQIRDKFS